MTKRELAYKKIFNAIVYGEIKPGEKITERLLSESLNIGTTPIREALHELRCDGLIDFIPNRGATVRKNSIKEVEDAYNVSALLESYAVQEATALIEPKQKLQLKKLAENMAKADSLRDFKIYSSYNSEFHDFFHKIVDNSVLSEQIKKIRNRYFRQGSIIFIIPDLCKKSLDDHFKITKMVSDGKATDAGNCMKEHLLRVKVIITDFLNNNPWA